MIAAPLRLLKNAYVNSRCNIKINEINNLKENITEYSNKFSNLSPLTCKLSVGNLEEKKFLYDANFDATPPLYAAPQASFSPFQASQSVLPAAPPSPQGLEQQVSSGESENKNTTPSLLKTLKPIESPELKSRPPIFSSGHGNKSKPSHVSSLPGHVRDARLKRFDPGKESKVAPSSLTTKKNK